MLLTLKRLKLTLSILVLHIDPITGRIKNEDDYDHSLFGGAPQEGLTPHHLKKAKLMFFYCRYPSSNVLKTYFPDVKVSMSFQYKTFSVHVIIQESVLSTLL